MVENSYAEYTWISDPLDGTTNYIRGIPHFAISIALQKNDKVILGMVFDVMQHDVYYAIEGQGAFKNGNKLYVNKPVPVSDMLIATGFPYDKSSITQGFETALNYFVHNSRCIRRLGSAALDLCFTASGVFDLYFEMHLSAWDYAAGTLIVKEAGGIVIDLNGNSDFRSGNILATNTDNREVVDFLIKTFK
jgi:myo-inositol-1(or 4)-monophosphatase